MAQDSRSGPTRATMKDVAVLAGVSPSTVSRVLCDKPSDLIGPQTRARVLEAATTLGYTPDPIARALRGKKTYLLGLILREIADPFFAQIVDEVSLQARAAGYHIVLGHAHSDPEQAVEITDILDTRHTDGVFILGDVRESEAVRQMLQPRRAVVGLCVGSSPASAYSVNTDNVAGVRLLVDHLANLGHRRIAFVDGGWLGDIRERREAFFSYLHDLAMPIRAEWVQTETNSAAGGRRAMARMLDLAERPTAVVVSDDVMAMGALSAAFELGVKVPDTLSVVGFDDAEFARFLCPSLTTVRQPIARMASEALSLMLRLVSQQDVPQAETMVLVPPELVVRQSSGPTPHE